MPSPAPHPAPSAFPFAIVGFDLDGTLIDSSGDLAAAVNDALAGAGRPPLPVAQLVTMIGGGARSLLAQALDATGGHDEQMLDRAHAAMLASYEGAMTRHTRLYPGVIEALDALAGHGVRLGVVTNKLERFATALLAAFGIADRFDCVIGGDTLSVSKPSPEPVLAMIARCGGGRAAFVGDSRFDVAAAHAAGIPAVACPFGFTQGPVEALGADAVIAGFGDLLPALEGLR